MIFFKVKEESTATHSRMKVFTKFFRSYLANLHNKKIFLIILSFSCQIKILHEALPRRFTDVHKSFIHLSDFYIKIPLPELPRVASERRKKNGKKYFALSYFSFSLSLCFA